jgi:uncharacterized membrane protein
VRSLLSDILTAFNNVYSGWILWNLFLAFIPLLLSFWLFRRKDVAQAWLVAGCGLVTAIGIAGLWHRTPYILGIWVGTLGDALNGDVGAQLKVLWLVVVLGVAFAMSIWLFNKGRSTRSVLWWLGLAVFIAFLPNAPYILTDIIHLIRGTSSGQIPTWVIALVFIPMHLVAILLGFEAYVISLLNLDIYLKRHGFKALILPTELLIHALSAVGIYLGRFIRLNSWDIVSDPTQVLGQTLDTLTSKRPVAVIVVTFIILAVFYWLMKQINLGIKLRIHYARLGIDVLDLNLPKDHQHTQMPTAIYPPIGDSKPDRP